jgi:vacuolar-type H+-ATPase subunit H
MKKQRQFLFIGAISLSLLVGCDAAENAANEAIDDAKESATQIAKETLSESMNNLTEQIDKAQESTKSWMDENGKNDKDEQEAEEGEDARYET